jgi:hypothetical protein
MGDTIWVDVQGRRKDDLPRDNSIMLRLKDELDQLSDELSVPRLTQFHDDSELRAAYADLMEQPAGDANAVQTNRTNNARESWFDPMPALRAVRKLHDHLEQASGELAFSEDRGRQHWRTTLLSELKNCQLTLEKAASEGRRFRFLIVP